MLTAEDLTRVSLIAGLYPEESGWISDDDIQGLGIFTGAYVVGGLYDPAYDRRLAIECLRVVIGRGIPEPRAVSLRQRIIELQRGAGAGAVSSTPPGETPGDDDVARAAIAAHVASRHNTDTTARQNAIAHGNDDDAHHEPVTASTGIAVDNNQVIALDLESLSDVSGIEAEDKIVILDHDDSFNPKDVLVSELPVIPDATARAAAADALTAAGLAHNQANAAVASAATNAAAIMSLSGGGGGIFITSAEVNVAMVFPDAEVGAVVLSIHTGTLRLYRVISTTEDPYLQYVGATATGGLTAGDLAGLLKAWVFTDADNPTAAQLSLNIQDRGRSAMARIFHSFIWTGRCSVGPMSLTRRPWMLAQCRS